LITKTFCQRKPEVGLKLDDNSAALQRLAEIARFRGDTYHAELYFEKSISVLDKKLEEVRKAKEHWDKERWQLGGLTDKVYNFVKNHKDSLGCAGIHKGWFKKTDKLETAKEQEQNLKKELIKAREILAQIEKEIQDIWLSHFGEVIGKAISTTLELLYECVNSIIFVCERTYLQCTPSMYVDEVQCTPERHRPITAKDVMARTFITSSIKFSIPNPLLVSNSATKSDINPRQRPETRQVLTRATVRSYTYAHSSLGEATPQFFASSAKKHTKTPAQDSSAGVRREQTV
jgi:hypothetical protein